MIIIIDLGKAKSKALPESCTPEPEIQSCDIGQQIMTAVNKLIITWMYNIKLNIDFICYRLQGS